MKRILAVTVFLLTISFNSFCQITWCSPGATWHNYYSSIGGNIGYVETKYVSDTIVVGINCKKLVEHQRYRYYFGGNITDIFKTHFTYESGRVIFMFNLIHGSNNWDTLYNFNTPVNSKWHFNSTDTIYIKVYGAGTKIIYGDTLEWRAINFVIPSNSNLYHDTLYERIGVTGYHFGFIDPRGNYDIAEPSIQELCNYQDNSFPVYGYTDSTCTQLPTGISDVDGAENSINIFPNPCTTCEIRGVTDATDIIVTDLLSKTLNTSFTKTSQGFSMQLPNAPAGIYFVKNIKTGEAGKFVKE